MIWSCAKVMTYMFVKSSSVRFALHRGGLYVFGFPVLNLGDKTEIYAGLYLFFLVNTLSVLGRVSLLYILCARPLYTAYPKSTNQLKINRKMFLKICVMRMLNVWWSVIRISLYCFKCINIIGLNSFVMYSIFTICGQSLL